MKKSVFAKYLKVFFLIIFISFIILGAIISSITIKNVSLQKDDNARKLCIELTNYLEPEIKRYYPASTSLKQYTASNYSNLNTMINVIADTADVDFVLMIVDLDGNVLVSSKNYYDGKISDEDLINMLNADEKKFFYERKLFSDMDVTYKIFSEPLNYNNETVGLVLSCYDMNSMSQLSFEIIKAIILTSLWVIIAGFIIVYILSEKITKPLKEMSKATKKLAMGNFNSQIEVKGDDEISELTEAFNKMAKSLAETDQMKSNFIASVSHDLRTPMTTISGFIDGILSGAIPKEQEEYYLNIIKQEIKRLSRLVTDLLEISKLEAGSRTFEYSIFDICEMMRIIVITFENVIDNKKLNVEFNTTSENIMVNSDRDCIYRILYNICDNAIKFSKEEGLLRINIKEIGNKVTISVYNEGIGIQKDELDHIFERFYKSDKSRGMDKSGTGLGLYIAKTMLDNLDGDISVESEYEKYCEFTVKLNIHNTEENNNDKN